MKIKAKYAAGFNLLAPLLTVFLTQLDKMEEDEVIKAASAFSTTCSSAWAA